ncbi:PARP14 [Bugula neritina]|uniref:PARP14 n=1 Tax=Bugula neritina TaxID=10212 RepID=A0A7J7K6L0_BUGNE|nr:PARP14 [Bugula neritina]
MPAIGAGQKGYPKDVVAHMIIQALTEYIESHPTTSLTNVRLYLFHRTDTRSEVEVFSKPFHQNLSKYSFGLKNDVTLYICKGALSNSEVDIMVNPTGSKTSLVLLKKGGQALQDECPRIKHLDVGEIAMTGAYGLPCAKIFHVNCPPWSDNVKEQSLQQIITDCLNATKDQKAKTIAFPAIGTGELHYPPEDVARCFFRTCAKFAKDNPGCGIKKILLVIDDADDGALQV